ncbi:hypothetical protein [Xanthomonas citri]|nr:hypothetical protein [Xanthomonas citri]
MLRSDLVCPKTTEPPTCMRRRRFDALIGPFDHCARASVQRRH